MGIGDLGVDVRGHGLELAYAVTYLHRHLLIAAFVFLDYMNSDGLQMLPAACI